MSLKNLCSVGGIAGLLAALGACLSAPATSRSAVTVRPTEARLVGVSSEGLEFLLKMDVRNSGATEVPVTGLAAQVTLDADRKVGTTSVSHPFVIPQHASTTLEVPVPVAFEDAKVFFDLSTAGRDVPFQMDGLLALGEGGASEQAFQLKGTVSKEKLATAMSDFTRTRIHY